MKILLDSLTKELNLPRTPDPLEVVRYAAQKHFIVFCCAVLPEYIPTKFHSFLADYLQKVYENIAAGIDERLMLAMPPQVGKSTLVSELFPAWIMGKKPWPIVCASYGTSLAELKSQHCRDIVDSDIYKYIFPKTRLNPDSTSKEFWQTSNKASYKAVGRGSGLTGHAAKILLCLPGTEKITTDCGDMEIKEIVENKLKVKILSFNHNTGKREFKEIEKYENNPGQEILEFEIMNGKKIQCTENHPIFVDGKGYIEARYVVEGDVLLDKE